MEGTPEIYNIIQLDSSYIDQVLEIENEAFITPWPRTIIENEAQNHKSYCRISVDKNNIVNGYCISILIYDELHILKVAVHENYRGKGIAKNLMDDSFYFFKEKGAGHALLEVRVSNETAINLYKKMGFSILRTRKNYYSGTNEDAYVMYLNLENYFQNVLSAT